MAVYVTNHLTHIHMSLVWAYLRSHSFTVALWHRQESFRTRELLQSIWNYNNEFASFNPCPLLQLFVLNFVFNLFVRTPATLQVQNLFFASVLYKCAVSSHWSKFGRHISWPLNSVSLSILLHIKLSFLRWKIRWVHSTSNLKQIHFHSWKVLPKTNICRDNQKFELKSCNFFSPWWEFQVALGTPSSSSGLFSFVSLW